LIYLDAGEDLTPVLGRVEPAGGKVVVPKTSIGEHGAIAVFIDSEGNRVGLHSLH
jgi:predicted enzyme related to lactoylglutathione lyase